MRELSHTVGLLGLSAFENVGQDLTSLTRLQLTACLGAVGNYPDGLRSPNFLICEPLYVHYS